MGLFPIGDQRVGIVTAVPVLDDDDNPVVTEFMEPVTTEVVAWIDNSLFEIQTPTEQQGLTVTTSEVAWAFLPIANGVLPAVDDDGEPVPITIRDEDGNLIVDDDGNVVLNSGKSLRHNGLTYVARGDAVLEQDIRGREHHVFWACERERG